MKSCFNWSCIRNMSINIKITWDKELSEKIKKLWEEGLRNARKKWLNEASVFLLWEVKKEVPVRSWNLKKSIQYEINGYRTRIYSDLFYALYVHEWTRPYTIRAIKKALYWIDERSKVWVFAKKVNHPWIKANPFFRRALEKNEKKIVEMFYSIIDDCVNDKWA